MTQKAAGGGGSGSGSDVRGTCKEFGKNSVTDYGSEKATFTLIFHRCHFKVK